MGDIIIVIILAVAVGAAIVPTVKHLKGQGGCCGGGSYKPRKKKLEQVIAKKTFYVDGMHCDNCSNRVMAAINDIPDVSAVVNYKKGIAKIAYAQLVDDSVIREKIEREGYTVTKIEERGGR